MAKGDPVLVADIGGTHARFALAGGGGRPGEPTVWLTSLHKGLDAALAAYLEQEGNPELAGAAICAAGPVDGAGPDARIAMTNCPWVVDAHNVAKATGVKAPHVVNDFTAVALSLPFLKSADVEKLGGTSADPAAPMAVMGPGTGLGVSALVPTRAGGFVPLSGEGGHVSLAPGNERELSLIFQLMQTYGHVSAERVLCGPGLENLYAALGALDGAADTGKPTAADIARMAREGKSALAKETVEIFTGLLGSVAGDLALTLGARGGVYLSGGILPRWGELFDAKLFRHRFTAKGRFRAYLAPVPTYLITVPDVALIGLAALARGDIEI